MHFSTLAFIDKNEKVISLKTRKGTDSALYLPRLDVLWSGLEL